MLTKTNSEKELFLMEEGITYLNCANMSPMLKSVREAAYRHSKPGLLPGNFLRRIGLPMQKY